VESLLKKSEKRGLFRFSLFGGLFKIIYVCLLGFGLQIKTPYLFEENEPLSI
jgi:hypothetical protein